MAYFQFSKVKEVLGATGTQDDKKIQHYGEMADALINQMELTQDEYEAPFQCLHCGLCEEVCQTKLPLRECYSTLEDRLEKRYGSPTEAVQNFVQELDSRRDFILEVFGLDLPEWSPEEPTDRVPVIEKNDEGSTR